MIDCKTIAVENYVYENNQLVRSYFKKYYDLFKNEPSISILYEYKDINTIDKTYDLLGIDSLCKKKKDYVKNFTNRDNINYMALLDNCIVISEEYSELFHKFHLLVEY